MGAAPTEATNFISMTKIRSYDDIITNDVKQQIINDYVNNNFTYKDIKQKYNIRSKDYIAKVLKNHSRSLSEAGKLAHIKYPDSFKHSEETKMKIRIKRLQYMKEHPENTAWRQSNESYPEKCFQMYLIDRGYDKKYLIQKEYSVFPYFIDFAFVDIKLAIEIDGSQHLEPERLEKDKKKDELLISMNWKVIRIAEYIVKSDWTAIDQVLLPIFSNQKVSQWQRVGIISEPRSKIKIPRNKFGRTEKQTIIDYKQRKVKNRPDKEELLQLITTFSFVEVGKKYGVTDNTIRKWCKIYQIPHRKKDLNNITYLKDTLR